MSVHRKLAISFLSVAFAFGILARCGSNELNAPKDDRAVRAQGTGVVSFAVDIQPIFSNRCTLCHNPEVPPVFRGSLDLTQDQAYANLVKQPTSQLCMEEVPDSIRVVPGDPAGSMLWLKTKPDVERCGRPMPEGTEGLGIIAPDEFGLIEQWIAQGALDN